MDVRKESNESANFMGLVKILLALIGVMLIMIVLMAGSLWFAPEIAAWMRGSQTTVPVASIEKVPTPASLWKSPDPSAIPDGPDGNEIRYGRELIVHTAQYLGPKGTVLPISNGMNCQNCHLDAGTRPFGNNYSAVAATYPKFRDRSGTEETIEKRVNDCFERSLNGSPLPENGREMNAIVAYIKWLGQNVPKGEVPEGSGLVELAFLDRPASHDRGKVLYEEKCVVCHGAGGEGILNPEGTEWTFPPLWGEKSYNDGAGLYRLSRFAGYIKVNMPLGATYREPMLTDEEAWDIAAYVNSLPRPVKDLSDDWPDISKKPIDHPFGPFMDGFSEAQHKYGPYKPIQQKQKQSTQPLAIAR